MTRLIQCPHCKCSFRQDTNTGKEIPMKVWLHREADKHGVNTNTIWYRLKRQPQKYYPNLQLRRVNQRVVFVKT